MIFSSKGFALALLVVAFSCLCDAERKGGMRVGGLRSRPQRRALARSTVPSPTRVGAHVREEDDHDEHAEDDHDEHAEDDHDEHEEDDHDEHAEEAADEHSEEEHQASVNLRIAAIFITGLTTLMGLAPFLAVAAAKIPQTLIIVVRAASAGTLLSLALVHILPEASHKLEAVTPYPLAGTLLAVGVFLSYAVQLAFHRSPQDPAVSLPKDAELGHAHPIGAYPIGAPWAPTASPFPPSHGAPTASPFPPNGGGPQCCSYPAGTGAAPSSGDNVSSDKVVILSMEAGCIVHSVIIGLALGLAGEYNTAAVLLAVLSIHQFLEGLCLGYLVSGLASQVEKVAAVVFTTLSVPVGIIAGLLVSLYGGPASNDTAGSHPALAIVQCLAGGLLLYTTLTSLVAEDLKREDVLADWRKRLAMGVSFLLGMATMSGVAAGEAFGGAHGH